MHLFHDCLYVNESQSLTWCPMKFKKYLLYCISLRFDIYNHLRSLHLEMFYNLINNKKEKTLFL